MRLIDTDALCEDLLKRWSVAETRKEELIQTVMSEIVTPIIASQPTIDAVQVVRCKDCKFEKDCTQRGFNDDFCSSGRRKDEDD